jgi:hypothetical protein
MTENKIPKLPVPPASWKLGRALARSTSWALFGHILVTMALVCASALRYRH